MEDILAQIVPILLTALVGLIGYGIVRIEKLVKASETDIDDKIFEGVKKAFNSLADEEVNGANKDQ